MNAEGPALVPPPVAPLPHVSRRRRLGIVFVLIALLIAAGAALYFSPVRGWLLSRFAPHQPVVVMLESANGPMRYTLEGSTLHLLPPVKAKTKATFFIKETAVPLANGTPVLGSAAAEGPSRNAMILTKDNRLLPIGIGSALSNLSSGTNGMVAFVKESGPVTALGAPHVWSSNATNGLGKDLGDGNYPVFAPDQSVLAFAVEGLVQLDPVTASRKVLVGGPYASSTAIALIAPTATYAVLPNGVTHAADVFTLNPLHTESLSYLGSIPAMPAVLGALDATSFLAGPDATHLTRYVIGKNGLTQSGSFTVK